MYPCRKIAKNEIMNKYLITICLIFNVLISVAQNMDDSCILETKYRNPIDTADISRGEIPCMVLFVHSTHENCHKCATRRMLEALAKDSLGFREQWNIKLYVVYPNYSNRDIKAFEHYQAKNAILAFGHDGEYRKAFGGGNATPFIILYDGKGHCWTRLGGTYDDLVSTAEFWLRKNME